MKPGGPAIAFGTGKSVELTMVPSKGSGRRGVAWAGKMLDLVRDCNGNDGGVLINRGDSGGGRNGGMRELWRVRELCLVWELVHCNGSDARFSGGGSGGGSGAGGSLVALQRWQTS